MEDSSVQLEALLSFIDECDSDEVNSIASEDSSLLSMMPDPTVDIADAFSSASVSATSALPLPLGKMPEETMETSSSTKPSIAPSTTSPIAPSAPLAPFNVTPSVQTNATTLPSKEQPPPKKKRVRRQRQELLYLREKVKELESNLKGLKEGTTSGQELPRKPMENTVWGNLAIRQHSERTKSEEENVRLRSMLHDQVKLATSLAQILRKRPSRDEENLFHVPSASKRHRSDDSLPNNLPDMYLEDDATLFQDQLITIGQVYGNLQSRLMSTGIGSLTNEEPYYDMQVKNDPVSRVHVEITASRLISFDWEQAAGAMWRVLSREGFLDDCYYQQIYRRDQHIDCRKFGLRVDETGLSAHSVGKRTVRRFIESDRVVFIWRAETRPLEISDAPMTGLYVQDVGWAIFSKDQGPASGKTRLSFFATMRPQVYDQTRTNSELRIGELTDFVLAAHKNRIGHFEEHLERLIKEETVDAWPNAVKFETGTVV